VSAISESLKYWLSVLNGLKSRGVQDILIASVDGLSGFVEAINAAFPKTEVQRCIIFGRGVYLLSQSGPNNSSDFLGANQPGWLIDLLFYIRYLFQIPFPLALLLNFPTFYRQTRTQHSPEIPPTSYEFG